LSFGVVGWSIDISGCSWSTNINLFSLGFIFIIFLLFFIYLPLDSLSLWEIGERV